MKQTNLIPITKEELLSGVKFRIRSTTTGDIGFFPYEVKEGNILEVVGDRKLYAASINKVEGEVLEYFTTVLGSLVEGKLLFENLLKEL